MLPSTSTIGTFFAVYVILLPSLVVSKRCDKQIDSFVRSNCMECSVNAFFQRPCPSGYQQVTSGEGEQSCAYSVFFGFNFGSMRVPGCQHNCSRKITQKECCAGFWGQDCQGIEIANALTHPWMSTLRLNPRGNSTCFTPLENPTKKDKHFNWQTICFFTELRRTYSSHCQIYIGSIDYFTTSFSCSLKFSCSNFGIFNCVNLAPRTFKSSCYKISQEYVERFCKPCTLWHNDWIIIKRC